MARYRVERRILLNFRAYNPGSEIELTEAQAKQFRNGQITPQSEPEPEPQLQSKPGTGEAPAPED